MEFIDKLDAEQRDNALLIAREAKKMGINPRLAVSLAYQESGLKTPAKPGSHGEIGIMQIKPATAEMIGFSREKLDNPAENIRAGLTYLKMGMDKFGDPVMAVAGYNAGHDHPFFTNPDKGLPESTKNYLKSIKGMGGFTQAEGEEGATEAAEADQPVEVSSEDFMRNKGRIMTDVVGAGTGAAAAKALDVGSKGVQFMGNLAETAKAMADRAKAGAPGAPGVPTGGLPPAQGPLQGPPAGGRMTQNWIGAQDTTGAYRDVGMKARSMAEAHQMKEAAIAAENKIRQIAPEMRQAPERAGLFVPSQTGAGPRGAPTVPIGPATPPPGPLERVTQAAGRGLGTIGASPVLSGALGGLGAAEGAQEFHQRYKAGDVPGMLLSGMGTVGGLASAFPHPIVRGVGMALSGASPLTLYLLDKMRASGQSVPPEMIGP
jgi:hypothetical protein